MISSPPPMHRPFTAAITGLRDSRIESNGTAPRAEQLADVDVAVVVLPAELAAGREHVAGAGDDERLQRPRRVHPVDGAPDAEVHVRGERVPPFGTIDRHPGGRAALLPSQVSGTEVDSRWSCPWLAFRSGPVQPVQLRVPRRSVPGVPAAARRSARATTTTTSDSGRSRVTTTSSRALHDPDTFCSRFGITLEAGNSLPMMLTTDPPEHTALRRLVSRAFTPRRVADLEPAIRALSTAYLDEMCERAVGRPHRRLRRAPARWT